MSRFRSIIAAAALGLIATGCGLSAGTAGFRPPTPPLTAQFGAADADGFVCPSGYNVVPDYDENLDGTMFFTVCHKTDDDAAIRVTGSTVDSPSICVYPVEVVDAENVFVKPDLSTGGLLKQCVSASQSDGFYSKTYYDFNNKDVRFDNTNYNAVIIIPAAAQTVLEACLNRPGGPNFNLCPHYSWGQFR